MLQIPIQQRWCIFIPTVSGPAYDYKHSLKGIHIDLEQQVVKTILKLVVSDESNRVRAQQDFHCKKTNHLICSVFSTAMDSAYPLPDFSRRILLLCKCMTFHMEITKSKAGLEKKRWNSREITQHSATREQIFRVYQV